MSKSKGAKAIERVALNNGVSVAEVRREIEAAMNFSRRSSEPQAQAFWDEYIKNGTEPTPEEFIIYMAKKVE